MSKKTFASWVDISGDLHFEVREGSKLIAWSIKGAESTSNKRALGPASLARVFREIADALDVPRETRAKPAKSRSNPVAKEIEDSGWDEPPFSPTRKELEEKVKAVTLDGGKWFGGVEDKVLPFMAPNGKEYDDK